MVKASEPLLIGLMAETPVHVGVGQVQAGVDLPVARERVTHWPYVPGSGVKGAFRVWGREQAGLEDIDGLFGREGQDNGSDGNAGGLLFSDARLLLLPVRALNKSWRWATSPALLRRLMRDFRRAGRNISFSPPALQIGGRYLGQGETGKFLGLEEREFEWCGAVGDELVALLAGLTGEDEAFIRERLIVLHDDDFAWFCRYGLPVAARNRLDEHKHVEKGALWYEESLAPDSFMYVLVGERVAGSLPGFSAGLEKAPYIQMGGNETIGQGWFRIVGNTGG